jgi:hypothetical protein
MAEHERHPDDRDRKPQHSDEPARHGDVLGISDADPSVEIPAATSDRGGNPVGIEVRGPATGTGDLRRTKGVTGIDMGAGGSGTDVDRSTHRPSAVRPDKE